MCIIVTLTKACVLGATIGGLPPADIHTLNDTDVGPKFVPVGQPTAKADTNNNNIEGKKESVVSGFT